MKHFHKEHFIIFLVKIVVKTDVNMMPFQDEVGYLFFIHKEAFKSESVNYNSSYVLNIKKLKQEFILIFLKFLLYNYIKLFSLG